MQSYVGFDNVKTKRRFHSEFAAIDSPFQFLEMGKKIDAYLVINRPRTGPQLFERERTKPAVAQHLQSCISPILGRNPSGARIDTVGSCRLGLENDQ